MANKREFYHASKTIFKPGDRLVPNLSIKHNFQSSLEGFVYMTSAPAPHFTVVDKALKENWTVYKVKPINPKRVWEGSWDDYITDRGCIVEKIVGSARGLSKAGRKPKTKSEIEHDQWLRERLEEVKAATKSDELRAKFIEYFGAEPEEKLKEFQEEIKWKHANVSQVKYKYRIPPGYKFNYNPANLD